MTSVTTIMALFQVLTMPDGSELTPKTVNDWFNLNARKTLKGLGEPGVCLWGRGLDSRRINYRAKWRR